MKFSHFSWDRAIVIFERVLQGIITLGLCVGFYYIAKYKSPPGKIFFLGKNVLSLAVLIAWCSLLLFWVAWIFRFHQKVSIRWRAGVYAILIIEATPYLYPFGINWPYEWPRNSWQDTPHFEWCYPGMPFKRREFSACGKQNSFGQHDIELSATPSAQAYRIAYIGNSQVEGRAIALEKKASKVAQSLLTLQIASPRIEIMDIYYSGMGSVMANRNSRETRQKRGVKHVIMKSMGVEEEIYRPKDPSQPSLPEPPRHLYHHPLLLRLTHTPASNFLSFVAWNGVRLYVELFAPEAVPSIQYSPHELEKIALLKKKIQSECDIQANRINDSLTYYAYGVHHSYFTFTEFPSVNPNESMTILQFPPYAEQISSGRLIEKYQNCLSQIHRWAFDQNFKSVPRVNMVDVTVRLNELKLKASDIYFSDDRHLNELGNQIAGEMIARGIQWYF